MVIRRSILIGAMLCCTACGVDQPGSHVLSNDSEQTGRFEMPTVGEFENNQIDSFHLAPTIKLEDGTRIPLDESVRLTNRAGNLLSWADVGIGLTASVSRNDGEITAVVDGNFEDAVYLWYGTMLYVEDYAFFHANTRPSMTFLYSHPFQTRVERVAMKLRGTTGTMSDVIYQPDGIDVFFSPRPSNFAGFAVLD
ncbi:MAG: hypothetical protein K6E59_06360 [Bacilli bacterium]|nr:hypothetical protein [Bacilli bacterium]